MKKTKPITTQKRNNVNITDKLTSILLELQRIQNGQQWNKLAEVQSRIPQIIIELAQEGAAPSITDELIEVSEDLQRVQSDLQDSTMAMLRQIGMNTLGDFHMVGAQRRILKIIATLAKRTKACTASATKSTLN